MQVKDLVKEVANFLQLTNVLDVDFDDAEEMAQIDAVTQRDINLIVKCLNQVLTRIATEYIELLNVEDIVVENGQFDLDDLDEQFCKIKRLGNGKKFEVANKKLIAENGEYELLYSYLPEEFDFDDDIEIYQNLSKYAIIYGICSEFLMIMGDFAQSETYESKFENAMDSAKADLKIVDPKQRRWR